MVAAVAPAPAPGVAEPSRVVHRVKSGETLSSIAQKYNTSVAAVRQINKLRGSVIKVGQRLTINVSPRRPGRLACPTRSARPRTQLLRVSASASGGRANSAAEIAASAQYRALACLCVPVSALATTGACSPASAAPPCSGSRPTRSPSKWTCRSGSPPSTWWACPTPPSARAATACGRRSRTPASSSRSTASPSTWRRPTCARPARRSTCRSRSACWPPPARVTRRAIDDTLVLGELSLDGGINGIRGVLPIAVAARRLGLTRLVLPPQNAGEACVVDGLEVCTVRSLPEAVEALNRPHEARIERAGAAATPAPDDDADLADVRGQLRAAAGARGRRGRRAQPADDRAAGRRQDDARAAAGDHPAAAHLRRGARLHGHPLGGRPRCRPAAAC